MKNKKGFTLVELLAVIAILAILMVLVLPNVLKLFQGGRKDAFKVQIQSIMRAAQTQKQNDGLNALNKTIYCYGVGSSCTSDMKLSVSESDVKYAVMFDGTNNVVGVAVENTNYCYVNTTDVTSIDENDFVEGGKLSCSGSTCVCSGSTRYVYWTENEDEGGAWYNSNRIPTTTYVSVSALNPSSTDAFMRSTVDDTDTGLKHEACLYYNNAYMCIGTDYFITGDSDGSQTKAKLEADMTRIFGTKPSCTTASNRADCMYSGSVRMKASSGDNMASDGTNSCNVNATNGKGRCQ